MNAPKPPSGFLPITEVAKIAGKTIEAVRADCSKGKIPHVRLGPSANSPIYIRERFVRERYGKRG